MEKIAHDIAALAHMCDKAAGKLLEQTRSPKASTQNAAFTKLEDAIAQHCLASPQQSLPKNKPTDTIQQKPGFIA